MGLGGAHFTIGLWFDQPVLPSTVLAVGDALDPGGRYDGDVRIGPSGVPFAGWFDLSDYRTVDRRTAESEAASTVYLLGLRLPVVGDVSVHFAHTATALPASEHPVEIDLEAGLLIFALDDLDRKDCKAAKAKERAVLRRMKAVCSALDPAYAVTRAESETPTPAGLAAGTHGLGPSTFLSRRLAGRPDLKAPVADLARLCATQDWGTGTQYEWGPARAERDRKALVAADHAVARVVGRILGA